MAERGQMARSDAPEMPEPQEQALVRAGDLILLIIGFGCLIGFSFLTVSGLSGNSILDLQPSSYPRLFAYAIGEVLVFLALAAAGWKERSAMRPPVLALAALCAAGVVFVSPFELPSAALIALSALGGASAAVLSYAWMLLLARFNKRTAALSVLIGFALACLLGEWAMLVGSDLSVGIAAVAAALAAAVVAFLDPKLESCKPDGTLGANDVSQIPWLTIALLVGCGFLASALCGVAGNSPQLFAWQPQSLVFELAFAAALVATVLVMFRSQNWVHVAWAPFLALFVTATTLSLFPFGGAVEFASGLMTAAMVCGMLLVWLVFPSLLSSLEVPRSFLAGILLACAGTPLAYFVGSAIGLNFPVGTLSLAGVSGSFAVIVSVLFAVTFIVNRRLFGASAEWVGEESVPTEEESAKEEQAEEVNPADALKTRLDEEAEKHGLTPRENEVALLTVQGFSCAYIADRLVVSSSTVRFHQQNIYRKFDVHSRNELIEIVSQDIPSEQG